MVGNHTQDLCLVLDYLNDQNLLISENIFFPLIDDKKVVRVLEKDLPILHGELFSSLDSIERSQVAHLLKQLGVKSFSPKDVINSHILPTLKSDNWEVSYNATTIYVLVDFIKRGVQHSTF